MARNASAQGKAPGQRQLRAGELVRHSLAAALQRGELFDPDLDHVSITVAEVRMSPDLRVATAYVLPLGGVNTEVVIAALERNRIALRKLVTRDVVLKFSPELRFRADETFDEMDRTRALLGSEAVRRDLDPD
jgi:ribosome-binding factor A